MCTKMAIRYFCFTIGLLCLANSLAVSQSVVKQSFSYSDRAFSSLIELADDQPISLTKVGLELISRPNQFKEGWTAYPPNIPVGSKANIILDMVVSDYPKWISQHSKITWPINSTLTRLWLKVAVIGWHRSKVF